MFAKRFRCVYFHFAHDPRWILELGGLCTYLSHRQEFIVLIAVNVFDDISRTPMYRPIPRRRPSSLQLYHLKRRPTDGSRQRE